MGRLGVDPRTAPFCAVADRYSEDMATTSPTRIDDELYASAKLEDVPSSVELR
jgi:hypothetical protein